MINGTNGAFVHPYLTQNEKLYIFSSAMCRSLNLVFLKESTYNGLSVYEFHLPKNIFANSTNNPDNNGFCENDTCLGNGVLNITQCSSGT
jgi:lysosome membrane protein 2